MARHFKSGESLPIAAGRKLYMDYQSRSQATGGIRKSSQKRYNAVFDKFERFASRHRLTGWEAVTSSVIDVYLAELESKKYRLRTLCLEGMTIKQTIIWLRGEGHLLSTFELKLKLKKPRGGSSRHCWTKEEFQLMVKHCRNRNDLLWLADVIVALGLTGVRISELVSLRWSDVDLQKGVIRLTDESSAAAGDGYEARTLKSGRDRSFPIHDDLRPILEAMTRHRDGYVFHGPLCGRLKADTVRNILKREVLKPIAESALMTISPRFTAGTLHSFRHFFCSECSNAGIAQRTVMDWLGHTDSKMIDYYYHLNLDESKAQMSKLRLGISQ